MPKHAGRGSYWSFQQETIPDSGGFVKLVDLPAGDSRTVVIERIVFTKNATTDVTLRWNDGVDQQTAITLSANADLADLRLKPNIAAVDAGADLEIDVNVAGCDLYIHGIVIVEENLARSTAIV